MRISAKEIFAPVQEIRRQNRCWHKLEDILFISLCTLIANGEDFPDMVAFGNQKENWLKQYIELPNGIPSVDTFSRVLEGINPKELSSCLEKHGLMLFNCISAGLEGRLINVDGKKLKGASPKSRGNKGLFILSAWVSEHQFSVGQVKVNSKSNEITAIPELLDELSDNCLKNNTITIDGIGCQTKIVDKILDKQAHYLLAVKNNQKGLREEIEDGFKLLRVVSSDENWEYDHGRYETRRCEVLKAKDVLPPNTLAKWQGIQTLVKIISSRTIQGVISCETRFYISSENLNAQQYNQYTRGHWSIENDLHWHLDVTFKEDACRLRGENAPLNLNILRKFALMKLKQMNDKSSIKKRRYKASLSDEYLERVINIQTKTN